MSDALAPQCKALRLTGWIQELTPAIVIINGGRQSFDNGHMSSPSVPVTGATTSSA